MAIRVNLLCLTGAVLGIISIFLPWVTTSTVLGVESKDTIVQDIVMRSGFFDFPLILAASLFTLGAFLSLLTPATGFVQLAATVGIASTVPSAYSHVYGDQTLSLGFYTGLISALIVAVSFFVPLGIGYSKGRGFGREVNWPDRLLTICPLSRSAKLRVNLLCVIGAFAGFSSMALPWILVTETTNAGAENVVELNLYYHLEDGFEVVALSLFLMGSVIAFLSPLGGILQLGGALWFASSASEEITTMTAPWGTVSVDWGVGFYLALLSSAVVLVSFFVPIGPGYPRGRRSIGKMLLAWGEATPPYVLR